MEEEITKDKIPIPDLPQDFMWMQVREDMFPECFFVIKSHKKSMEQSDSEGTS